MAKEPVHHGMQAEGGQHHVQRATTDTYSKEDVDAGLAAIEAALAPQWPFENESRAMEPARQALAQLRATLSGALRHP